MPSMAASNSCNHHSSSSSSISITAVRGLHQQDDQSLSIPHVFITISVEVTYQSTTMHTTNFPASGSQEEGGGGGKFLIPHKSTDDIVDQRCFQFPCDSLRSDDSSLIVSKMFSDLGIPFSLKNLRWRSALREDWTPLKNVDDLIKRILEFVNRMIEIGSSGSSSGRKLFPMFLIIKKHINLPDPQYKSMIHNRNNQETAQKINNTLHYLIESQIFLSRNLSRTNAKDFDSLAACVICMEEFMHRVRVTRLPCSHIFHRNCIIHWLHRSHICPSCRFQLPQQFS